MPTARHRGQPDGAATPPLGFAVGLSDQEALRVDEMMAELERQSGGAWKAHGCTQPHSSECRAAFDIDCPKLAALNTHMSHQDSAVDCRLEPCISSPWWEHRLTV